MPFARGLRAAGAVFRAREGAEDAEFAFAAFFAGAFFVLFDWLFAMMPSLIQKNRIVEQRDSGTVENGLVAWQRQGLLASTIPLQGLAGAFRPGFIVRFES
jgi:hypothetical protein